MYRQSWVWCLFALLVLPVCQKKADLDQTVGSIKLKKVRFIPPSDSSVTLSQLESWKSATPLLDSLSIFFEDSFKVEDPGKLIRFQKEFMEAMDRICVLSGLRGGYDEYRWIQKTIRAPVNKAVRDSLGISILDPS